MSPALMKLLPLMDQIVYHTVEHFIIDGILKTMENMTQIGKEEIQKQYMSILLQRTQNIL